MNFIVVAASIGFGMIPIVSPGFYDQFPEWFAIIFGSGISSAAILAIALNILFNHVNIGTPSRSALLKPTGEKLEKS